MATDTLVEVTQADRELWKFILDAPFATCSRIDNLPSDCPELQEIARHRLASQASTDRPTSELVEVNAHSFARLWSNYCDLKTENAQLEATIARLQAGMKEAVGEAFVLEIDVDGQAVAYLDLAGRPCPTPDDAVQFARRVDAETYLENARDLWRLAGLSPYVTALRAAKPVDEGLRELLREAIDAALSETVK